MVYVWVRLDRLCIVRVGRKTLLPGYQYQIITHKKNRPRFVWDGLFVLAFIVGLRKACNPTRLS